MRGLFPPHPGARQIIVLKIESIQTSCGYAVPLFTYEGERDTYPRWAEKKGVAGLCAYQKEKNLRTIDGLPTGLVVPETAEDDDPIPCIPDEPVLGYRRLIPLPGAFRRRMKNPLDSIVGTIISGLILSAILYVFATHFLTH